MDNTNQQIIGNSIPTTIYHDGFNYAVTTNANPDSLHLGLDSMYETFLRDQKQGIQNKIQNLKQLINNKNGENQQLTSQVKSNSDTIKNIEEDIKQMQKSNGGYKQKYMLSFTIATFITILLTLFVIMFYSSTAYIMFEHKADIYEVFNPKAWSEVSNTGTMVFMVLFPVIFLGLGFLIHTFLDKKKYYLIAIFVTITLAADGMMGYMIADRIYKTQDKSYNDQHIVELQNGTIESFDKVNGTFNAFAEKDFYLFILLGFVVYMIWGFLLHYILSHPYLETDFDIIKDLRKQIAKLQGQNNMLEGKVIHNNNQIKLMKDEISELENLTTIPVSIPALRGYVGKWMGGIQNYINGSFPTNQAKELARISIEKSRLWIEEKTKTLITTKK